MKIFKLFLIILGTFWGIRTIKEILFYLYLWQLKEYHLGRFLDHFRTRKGKSLFWNKKYLIKIFLLGFVPFIPFFGIGGLILIYILESFSFFSKIIKKKFKHPVLTKKTVFLIIESLFFSILFLFLILFKFNFSFGSFAFSLLVFDILTPFVVSFIVFSLEPLVLFRKFQIMKKAKRKISSLNSVITIGITGSYGKTSTKEILSALLETKFNILKTPQHKNSEMGISQTILEDLKPEHDFFICEMGAYNKGGIKLLTDIAKPQIGILTGINEQHMATFGSQKIIIETKLELIRELPKDGTAILNLDSEIIRKKKDEINSYNPKLENIFFTSSKQKADLWVKDIKTTKKRISFKIVSKKKEEVELNLKIAGRQSVENILTAVCCAMKVGMTLKEIKEGISNIEQTLAGLSIIERENKMDIVDSSYSSNPAGVIADLNHLKHWSGKKIIIIRPLIELGEASKTIHRKIGKKIGEICDLAVLVTKDHIKDIKKTASKEGLDPEKIISIDEIKEDYFNLKKGVILLEGRMPRKIKEILKLKKEDEK